MSVPERLMQKGRPDGGRYIQDCGDAGGQFRVAVDVRERYPSATITSSVVVTRATLRIA